MTLYEYDLPVLGTPPTPEGVFLISDSSFRPLPQKTEKSVTRIPLHQPISING